MIDGPAWRPPVPFVGHARTLLLEEGREEPTNMLEPPPGGGLGS